MVSLPGGDWAVQMATGRLLRGDGQPMEEAYARVGLSSSRILRKAPNTSGTYVPAPTSPDAAGQPGVPKASEQDALAKARKLLEDALKSAGK